ncbi:MAG: carboxypeptidase regulatory-like domain-containing protein [Rhodothermales bacterium]|nr:carboxypeptidase regulatory-like domain-containing protein [Rhodothermales bacterium]MBO6779085.1 carboxypeptidase regulatory-like domain-containing protein [Rhodothermales bacterium]
MGHEAGRNCILIVIMALLGAMAAPAQAQEIRLQETTTPLAEALVRLAGQTSVDLVYAQSLVQNVTISCAYTGPSALNALRCLLRGTGLDARTTRPGQIVIVEAAEPIRRRTVSGLVSDDSGLPLAGAHVFLTDLSRGAITNRTGFFTFPDMRSGLHRVRISFLGFAPLDTLIAASDRPAAIRLRTEAVSAQDVLVESSEPRPGDRTPLPGMVAPPIARLERLPASLGGQDLLEALTWMPGIRRAGEVTGGLLVRGAGPDQNLYLLDGAPVYHPWHAFSLISTFQTETFRSVRVFRGAFPAEFGGRLSAVLDAELSDGRGPEPRASGAVNTHSARFLIEAPLSERASFMLGGRRSYVDRLIGREHPVEDDLGRKDTLKTGYYFYDWTAKLVFRPDDLSRVSITSYRGRDDLDLRLPFDVSLDLSSWLRPTDLLFEVSEWWRNRVVSVRYERLLSTRWYLTATSYDSRYQAREGAYLRPTLASDVRSTYGVDIRDAGLRVDMDYFRSDRHEFRMGWQAVSREFDSDVDALIRYNPDLFERLQEESNVRSVELSGYAQDTWRPSRHLEVLAGLRAVAFGSDRQIRLEPRLSAQWTLHPRLLLARGSFTRSYQYLHRIRDRHSFLYDIVSSRWIPSSRSADPARGTEWAVGLETRPRAYTIRLGGYLRRQHRVLLPRDVFQSKDDLSGPGIEVGTLLGQYEPGEARAFGVEAGLGHAGRRWMSQLSLTAERSDARPETGNQPFRPTRFDVPLAGRLYVERRWGAWSLGGAAVLRSGYPITVPEARYELSGPLDQEPVTYLYRPTVHNGRLPAYGRIDISAARDFRWLDAAWHVRLQLYNVLNHRNVIDRFYEPEGSRVVTRNQRGLPILPLFELRLDL